MRDRRCGTLRRCPCRCLWGAITGVIHMFNFIKKHMAERAAKKAAAAEAAEKAAKDADHAACVMLSRMLAQECAQLRSGKKGSGFTVRFITQCLVRRMRPIDEAAAMAATDGVPSDYEVAKDFEGACRSLHDVFKYSEFRDVASVIA